MDYLKVRTLYHHGIKGQKWGLRRYQNEDGTLTDAGKKRYGGKESVTDLSDDELANLNKRVGLEVANSKLGGKSRSAQNIDSSREIANETANILNATARALPSGNGKTIKKDYSHLSDTELRNRISRLQLEESYGRLSGDTKYVKSGSEKAREILQTTGAAVAIGASVVGIAAKIAEVIARNKANKNK